MIFGRDSRLLLVYGRLVRRALERVQQIALLDVSAFREKLLLQVGAHARNDVDAVDRLNTAIEFVAVGHRLALHRDHSDRRGTGRHRLSQRRCGQKNAGQGKCSLSVPAGGDLKYLDHYAEFQPPSQLGTGRTRVI